VYRSVPSRVVPTEHLDRRARHVRDKARRCESPRTSVCSVYRYPQIKAKVGIA
jgi:hypothetical protein